MKKVLYIRTPPLLLFIKKEKLWNLTQTFKSVIHRYSGDILNIHISTKEAKTGGQIEGPYFKCIKCLCFVFIIFFKWRNGFKSNCILALILPLDLLSLTYIYVFGSYPNVIHTCIVYLMNIF